MSLSTSDLKRSIIQRDAEIARLREIEAAARDLHSYEDFEEPNPCEHCRPDDPTDYNAARRRLYDALSVGGPN